MVTATAIGTLAAVGTVRAVESLWTGELTIGPSPARRTGADSTDMVTLRPVLTLTLVPTVGPVPTSGALLIAVSPGVARFADTVSRHRVTAPVAVAAVTAVETVHSPLSAVTGSPTVMARPPRWARASTSYRVTLPIILTRTS